MKTVGRGRDYQKALEKSLTRSLEVNKKITTTRARAQLLKSLVGKKHGGDVMFTPVEPRRGDSAPQVLVELVQKEKNENRTNTKQSDKKKVASR